MGEDSRSQTTHPGISRNAAKLTEHGVFVHAHDPAEHGSKDEGLGGGPGLDSGPDLVPERSVRRLERGSM